MFYISLPNFYSNYSFNNFFKRYISNPNNSKKLIAKFQIEYVYGAFPWSYWNGGHNTHIGQAVLTPQMNDIITHSASPVRLDYSNIYIKEHDLYDVHENATLKQLFDTGGIYEISNEILMNYITTQNKNMKYIISNNSQILNLFSEQSINNYILNDQIELINIDNISELNLDEIINKNKIEININDCQQCDNIQKLQCNLSEHTNIYNLSSKTIYPTCSQSCTIIDFYDELKPYLKKGIVHFKINTNKYNLQDFNFKIITSFIKPEYVGECLIKYYESIR